MALILVVDDDAMARETARVVLASAGHQVVVAKDGAEGLAICRRSSPALVVTDIIMPEKDGIELIAELRAERPAIKIVAISGGGRRGNMDFLAIAGKLGANAIVPKPYDPDELTATVERCLGAE